MLDYVIALTAAALIVSPQTAKSIPTDAKIVNVAWLRPPDPEAISQYTPPFAVMIGVGGRVDLRCSVEFEGPPQNCRVVTVQPEGLGFEDAAQLAAATGVLSPRLVNGVPHPAALRFTVNFRADPIPERPDAPYDGPEPSRRAISLARQVLQTLATPAAIELYKTDRQEWMAMIEDLPSDRQAIVAGWLDELFPYDEQSDFERTVLALARLTTEADLEAFLKSGTIPPRPPSEELERAFGSNDETMVEALTTLRARYCSRWDCGNQPDG